MIKKCLLTKKLNIHFFYRMNKSASGFTICEDFERLKRLKCGAPKQIQAQRELNPSVANWKSAGAFIVQFIKICDIHFFIILAEKTLLYSKMGRKCNIVLKFFFHRLIKNIKSYGAIICLRKF